MNIPPRIAIIGKGNFGRSLIRLLEDYAPDCPRLVLDKAADSARIEDLDKIKTCDVVIPAVPLAGFMAVLRQLSPHLSPGSIVIDVCTTKTYPAQQMRQLLPQNVYLVTTHPLFGPESLSQAGWKLQGLNLVIWPERIPEPLFAALLEKLHATGLNVILKSPEEHDRTLAETQFLSLLTGALLERLDIYPSDMNTRSFDDLLVVKATTRNDFHILRDVYRYNPHCHPVLEKVQERLAAIAGELREYQNKADIG